MTTLGEVLVDGSMNQERQLAAEERRAQILLYFTQNYDPESALLVIREFGLDGEPEQEPEDLAAEMGIDASVARQRLRAVLKDPQLQKFLFAVFPELKEQLASPYQM